MLEHVYFSQTLSMTHGVCLSGGSRLKWNLLGEYVALSVRETRDDDVTGLYESQRSTGVGSNLKGSGSAARSER